MLNAVQESPFLRAADGDPAIRGNAAPFSSAKAPPETVVLS